MEQQVSSGVLVFISVIECKPQLAILLRVNVNDMSSRASYS